MITPRITSTLLDLFKILCKIFAKAENNYPLNFAFLSTYNSR